jgi:hypothetical protein
MTTVEFKLGGTLKFLVEPESRAGAMITLSYRGFSVTARGEDMSYTLPIDMAVHVQVAYTDSHGNPARVDGAVEWGTSDANIATVTAEGSDGLTAIVATATSLGQAQITATADADLGEGVREIVTIMDVEVIAGEAVAGVITPVGAPVPKP